MRSPSPHSIALALTLLTTLSSSVALAAKSASGSADLTVSVAVEPICTVAVTPGEWSADEGVDVQCRNFSANQPEPVVSDTAPAVSENAVASPDAVRMVVINF